MPRHAARFARAFSLTTSLAVVAVAAPAAMAQSPSFTLLGFPPPQGGGTGNSRAMALSADGRSAAGYSSVSGVGDTAFHWTADGGRNDFGQALGLTLSYGFGMSGDGRTVVGRSGPASTHSAFRWSQASGYQSLGVPIGLFRAEARDASHDGSVIVGTAEGVAGGSSAFRWTQSTGIQVLPLGGGTRANAISGDGNVIVGERGNAPEAFSWTQAGGFQFLPSLGGTGGSYAKATNSTGNIVVGLSGPTLRTTMWTNGVPVELLSSIPNVNIMTPYGVSDDGSVVAGEMSAAFAGVWTPATGTIRLSDYLTANGVVLPQGIVLESCHAVSADGRTFAGYTTNGIYGIQGYVATIPAPCPADLDNDGSLTNGGTRDRAVTIDDLLYLLAAFESGNLAADLDNGSNTGTRDNAVTIDDLLYFLSHFEAGC